MATATGSLDLKSLNNLRDDVTQYFWFNSDSPVPSYGNGVHITLSPQTTFASNPSGQNILINTDGISIRNGVLPMMVLDNDSLDFNVIDTTNSTYTNVASFGVTSRIGEQNNNRIELDTTKIQFQSPSNLMFRVRNNGTTFHDNMSPYMYDPDTEDAYYEWASGETGLKTAEMNLSFPLVSIDNILLKIRTIGETSITTINTGDSNPYNENGYTISYSVDIDENITLNITKNNTTMCSFCKYS